MLKHNIFTNLFQNDFSKQFANGNIIQPLPLLPTAYPPLTSDIILLKNNISLKVSKYSFCKKVNPKISKQSYIKKLHIRPKISIQGLILWRRNFILRQHYLFSNTFLNFVSTSTSVSYNLLSYKKMYDKTSINDAILYFLLKIQSLKFVCHVL